VGYGVLVGTAPDMRSRLVAAAEQLFFERGLDGASLREINAAAGARNASAVQYHLGDRTGVVRAILEKHSPAVEAARHALLDAFEAEPRGGLRALAGAYVRPLAAKLTDPDGGAGYLQVLSDLTARPEPALELVIPGDAASSTQRWRELVAPLMPPRSAALHRRFAAMQLTHAELARRAHMPGRSDHRLFTSDLVDLVAAMLGARVSAETARLAEERDARRRARAS